MSGAGLAGLEGAGLGGSLMSEWMIDTFIYTSMLIMLVLLLRRPVTQHFGPRVAYSLWALPLLRFIMPPIVLPAWMAPADPVAQTATSAAPEPMIFLFEPTETMSSLAGTADPAFGVSVGDFLIPLWIAGALAFLTLRVREYVRMRRSLLADARPMGEAGDVRLVETPAVSAPVAFGIRDKVVALPVGFMAMIDVKARDMAIAHELEHHRGHDLLANIAAQPLLALHWFNPLAWWGWRAMRRDQEAACDARVVAGRAWSERAAYAEVIAGFAAGEHLALAAPMACPVLGEKSIIHRLRSLTMNEHSNTRRRIGIAAITTTALALPLTASISYAQDEGSVEGEDEFAIEMAFVEQDEAQESDQTDSESEHRRHVIVREIESDEEGEGEHVTIRRTMRHGDGEHGHAMSEEEHAELMAEIEREMGDLREHFRGEHRQEMEMAVREARRAGHDVRVRMGEAGLHDIECDANDPVVSRELEDGRRMVTVCHSGVHAAARDGLREAIEDIRNDPDIPERMRENIIREMQRSIERMDRRHQGAMRLDVKLPRQPNAAPTAVARARADFVFARLAPQAGGRTARFDVLPSLAPQLRTLSLVNPVQGVRVAAPADADCEQAGTRA